MTFVIKKTVLSGPTLGQIRGSCLTVWDERAEQYRRVDRREVWFGGRRGWQPFRELVVLFALLPTDVRLLVGLLSGHTSLIKPKRCLPPPPLAIYHHPLVWDQPSPTHGQTCQWGDCTVHFGKTRAGRPACEVATCSHSRCWYDEKHRLYKQARFLVCSFCALRQKPICMWCWADKMRTEEAREVARVWLVPAHRRHLLA